MNQDDRVSRALIDVVHSEAGRLCEMRRERIRALECFAGRDTSHLSVLWFEWMAGQSSHNIADLTGKLSLAL